MAIKLICKNLLMLRNLNLFCVQTLCQINYLKIYFNVSVIQGAADKQTIFSLGRL